MDCCSCNCGRSRRKSRILQESPAPLEKEEPRPHPQEEPKNNDEIEAESDNSETSLNYEAAAPLARERLPPQLQCHNYSPPAIPHYMHGHPTSFTSSDSGGPRPLRTPLNHLFDPPDPNEVDEPYFETNQVYRVIHPYGKIPTTKQDPTVNSPKNMTGNTFFAPTSGSGALAKSKSGTLPDRYANPPHPHPTRGFRDTFVSSMTSSPPPPRSSTSSPYYTPGNRNERHSSPGKGSSSASNNNPPPPTPSSANSATANKKWSFGGLFKRKAKPLGNSSSNINSQSQSPTRIQHRNSSPGGAGSVSMSHSSPSRSFSPSGNATPHQHHPGIPHYANPNPHVQQLNPGSGYGSPGAMHRPHHLRNRERERSSSSGPPPSNAVNGNGNKYGSTPTHRGNSKGKASESDITSDDSEIEVPSQIHAPTSFKQNFLTRRLSRRKEKAAAKKKAAADAASAASMSMSTPTHGLLRVPLMNNGKRVGSSPDSLNNGNPAPGNGVGWEITKKVPQLQAVNNYSSSGSLSLSQEGSSKGSRAAAKEAVKARAVARRESFLQDSSSDDGEVDEDGRSRSSVQGSHSSLTPSTSRGQGNGNGGGVVRRQRPYSSNIVNLNTNQLNNNYSSQGHLGQGQGQPFRPVVVVNGGGGRGSAPSSPARFDRRNNNSSSPQVQRKGGNPAPPGSPRWEARVIYTQENHENETPFIVRLPPNRGTQNQPNRPPSTQPTSGYGNPEPEQQVITAGLRVPIAPSGTNQQGGQITEEVHYANLPNGVGGGNKNDPRFRSATPLNYPIVSASPPPPPPPRREYSRLVPNNQNFYRPVSCSYLDSYQQQAYYNQHPHHPHSQMRVASPAPNLNYYGESPHNHHPIPPPPQPQVNPGHNPQHNGNYYYATNNPTTDQVQDNARNFLSPKHSSLIHPSLIRSPSEPPEIKVSYARRDSPVRRNASTPTPNYYYYNNNQESFQQSSGQPQQPPQQPSVVTSKLGYPVRRLNEPGKIPLAQSPVHMRASEFWRKKEAEVSGVPVGPNPNHARYMNRIGIRSADSSPLPVHRMRASPGVGIQNSNESISSLSSFSAEAQGQNQNQGQSPHPGQNQGHSPHPQHGGHRMMMGGGGRKIQNSGDFSNHGQSPRGNTPTSLLHGRSQSPGIGYNATATVTTSTNHVGHHPYPHPRQESGLSKSDREQTPQHQQQMEHQNPTASERLKVRNLSAPETPQESNKLRSLVDLNNGKTPGRNLEDALNELEDMYKSLRLSDEDLLDRAERRDLPTPHQQLRHAPLIPLPASYQNHGQVFRYNDNHPHFSVGGGAGSVESLATGSSSTTGSGGSGTPYSNNSSTDNPTRVRAPPLRRSARPDTVQDDMARRRFENLPGHDTKPALDPRNVISQTGSYMMLSPAFSPPVSPCPPETLPVSFTHGSSLLYNQDEPDLTLDDVTFRQYKQANSIRIIDPQPKFGIPLGPTTAAPGTDYLHSKRSDRLRPLFKAVKNPDLVNDDIAFRNLRKDLNSDNNLSKDWTPRLFSPNGRGEQNTFSYPSPDEQSRKLRAIRSLSANITNYTPFMEDYSPQYNRAGEIVGHKWNSFTDLHGSGGSGVVQSQNPPQTQRGSSHWRPSWVEQVERVGGGRNESGILLGVGRRSNNKFFEKDLVDGDGGEDEYWERKLPSKTVELTPDLYDPTRSRRPWTDIILESFEKEKQLEEERLAKEAEDAAIVAAGVTNVNTINDPRGTHPSEELDDDVFLDARDKSKSTSPDKPTTNPGEGNKILTNYSDFNTSHNPHHPLPPLSSRPYNRRGSWVEPGSTRTSSSSYLSPTGEYPNTEMKMMSSMEQDLRRKSWSGLPKSDQDQLSRLEPNPKLWSPLPPPRKIKQINLDQFNSSSNSQQRDIPRRDDDTQKEFDHQQNSQIPGESHPTQSNSDTKRKKGEAELNALMDMLIREADSCGAYPTPNTRVNVSLSEKEEMVEGSVKRREFESNRSSKPPTPSLVGVTQKDSQSLDGRGRNVVPKNLQKEFQIDEPTKKSSRRNEVDNTMSKQRAAVLEKPLGLEEPPPEIVAVSRKHPLPSRDFYELDEPLSTRKSPNLSANYSVCSTSKENVSVTPTTTTTTTITVPTTEQRPSSIEALIDSINESLPELETPRSGAFSTASTKSNGSSLSSGSGGGGTSPPRSTSPRSVSPVTVTTITLTHRPRPVLSSECSSVDDPVVEEEGSRGHEDDTTMKSSSTSPKEDDPDTTPSLVPRRSSTTSNSSSGSERAGPSGSNSKKEEEQNGNCDTTTNDNRRESQHQQPHSVEETGNGSVERFLSQKSTNKSQSQIGRESKSSSSPILRSEFGDEANRDTSGRKQGAEEPDKSQKRKSQLNRASPDQPISNDSSSFHPHATINTCEIKPNPGEGDGTGPPFSPTSKKKSSTSIYKVPRIPSILTTNNHKTSSSSPTFSTLCSGDWSGDGESSGMVVGGNPRSRSTSNNHNGMSKSPDNSISARQLPPSPSLKHKSHKSNILNKVQTFESVATAPPLVKRDQSFSDAEGVSFIKKLLIKESMEVKKQREKVQSQLQPPQKHFVLKKSPSAGSTNGGGKYWSKFSNGEPIFLQKFFAKGTSPSHQNSNNSNKDDDQEFVPNEGEMQDANTLDENINHDPIVTCDSGDLKGDSSSSGVEEEPPKSYSVAQKASFFMKLEHDQRFSKWRKNSLDGSSCPSPTKIPPPPQQTQNTASILPGITDTTTTTTTSIRSRSRQLTQPITTTEVQLAAISGNIDTEEEQNSRDEKYMSFTTGEDDEIGMEMGSNSLEEPSKLSLKDRVYMFDKLIAVGGKPQQPPSTPVIPALLPHPLPPKTGFPVIHSSSAVISSSRGNLPISRVINPSDVTALGSRHSAFFTRRGSTSDIELNPPKYSPIGGTRRSSKTRSLYVNNDELSEDGEVSSGGQEVSDIISRSYENTPIARKKSLKNAKQPPITFTKEIWRRCKVNEKNTAAAPPVSKCSTNFPQPIYKVTTNVTHAVMPNMANRPHDIPLNVGVVDVDVDIGPSGGPQESSPPTTSNLLQFLTGNPDNAHHPSRDELELEEVGNSKSQQSRPSSSQQLHHFREDGTSIPNSDGNSSRVQIHIPHPDNESFQLFFGSGKSSRVLGSSSISMMSQQTNDADSGINLSSANVNNMSQSQWESNLANTEMNVVQRESDLLVMKKNVQFPLLRRKSSRGSDGRVMRNPLRALAARIDFRNQYYTENGGSGGSEFSRIEDEKD